MERGIWDGPYPAVGDYELELTAVACPLTVMSYVTQKAFTSNLWNNRGSRSDSLWKYSRYSTIGQDGLQSG